MGERESHPHPIPRVSAFSYPRSVQKVGPRVKEQIQPVVWLLPFHSQSRRIPLAMFPTSDVLGRPE